MKPEANKYRDDVKDNMYNEVLFFIRRPVKLKSGLSYMI